MRKPRCWYPVVHHYVTYFGYGFSLYLNPQHPESNSIGCWFRGNRIGWYAKGFQRPGFVLLWKRL